MAFNLRVFAYAISVLPVGRSIGKEKAAGIDRRLSLVEAAGQLFHLFRDGLDYAFILLGPGCGACYPVVITGS